MIVLVALVATILGIAIGYYARQVYDYVKATYETLQYRFDAKKAGVVTPSVSKATRAQPIDLSSNSGIIRRPSPREVVLQSMEAREERLRNA